jgi:hypothetical protein
MWERDMAEIDSKRLERLLAEADKAARLAAGAERRAVKYKHPYVADLIRALKSNPDGRSRIRVIEVLEAQRKKDGLSIPPKFEQAVQAAYNRHAAGSQVFAKEKKVGERPLFYSPSHGQWAVYEDAAVAWLEEQFPTLEEL